FSKILLLYAVVHFVFTVQSNAELDSGALQGLLALPKEQISKISLDYEHQLAGDKGMVFFNNHLIWDLRSNKYFWKREQYSDK
ncbi:hypothetical protein Q6332_29970, partial [Klebsiella pneumoniae]|uniref:hypothetical protein n=1 Tax=Klebsiella pneumoniae TaxID=573 RepID=UPI0027316B23